MVALPSLLLAPPPPPLQNHTLKPMTSAFGSKELHVRFCKNDAIANADSEPFQDIVRIVYSKDAIAIKHGICIVNGFS